MYCFHTSRFFFGRLADRVESVLPNVVQLGHLNNDNSLLYLIICDDKVLIIHFWGFESTRRFVIEQLGRITTNFHDVL